MSDNEKAVRRFGQAPEDRSHNGYRLRLYVTGASPRSIQAIANVKLLCEEYLRGQYELEIIDLYQQPELAAGKQIVVAPTLVKEAPPPARRLIGTMSHTRDVLHGLGLIEA
jgi:circadian clock protein KaiB